MTYFHRLDCIVCSLDRVDLDPFFLVRKEQLVDDRDFVAVSAQRGEQIFNNHNCRRGKISLWLSQISLRPGITELNKVILLDVLYALRSSLADTVFHVKNSCIQAMRLL